MRAAVLTIAIGGLAALLSVTASQAFIQSYKPGDVVEASPMALSSHWESCTVLGMSGPDVQVACGPRQTEYVVQAKWVRRGGPAASQATTAAGTQGGQSQAQGQSADPSSCPDAPRSLVGRKPQEHGICRVGARLVDRQGRTGTVIAALDGSSCQLCFADGSSRGYLTWMLASAGSAGAAQSAAGRGGGPASGIYQCSGGAAGNMRITISGGRWNGYYAETLPDGRIGISSQPNGRPYYMICQR